MTRYSEAIARELRLPETAVDAIRTAAALHDLGKFLVPHGILSKPGPLTPEERELVRRHPADGAALLDGVVEPAVAEMVRCHHERYDGSGYPAGLAGEEIPLGARVIAVADSYDAMTSDRPYRKARSRAVALAELRAQAGILFDAAVVAAFALRLDEVARGIDVPAARDLHEALVEPPAIGPLVA